MMKCLDSKSWMSSISTSYIWVHNHFSYLPGSRDTMQSTPQPDLRTASFTLFISTLDTIQHGAPWTQQPSPGHKPLTSYLSYPSLWACCSKVNSLAIPETPTWTISLKKIKTHMLMWLWWWSIQTPQIHCGAMTKKKGWIFSINIQILFSVHYWHLLSDICTGMTKLLDRQSLYVLQSYLWLVFIPEIWYWCSDYFIFNRYFCCYEINIICYPHLTQFLNSNPTGVYCMVSKWTKSWLKTKQNKSINRYI